MKKLIRLFPAGVEMSSCVFDAFGKPAINSPMETGIKVACTLRDRYNDICPNNRIINNGDYVTGWKTEYGLILNSGAGNDHNKLTTFRNIKLSKN
jgi:hypothetical protein